MNQILYMLGMLICLALILKNTERVVNGFYDAQISIEDSLCLRGMAASLIIFHHIQQKGYAPSCCVLMGYIGFIMVAIFFFLSGYGLVFGFLHKNDYFKGFLLKHLLSIYLPYWIIITLNNIYIIYIKNKEMDFYKLAIEYLGISDIWFVTAIIIFYIVFYISFKIIRPRHLKYLSVLLLLLLYNAICFFTFDLTSYTASTFSFLCGMIWQCKNEWICKKIRKNYTFYCVCFFLLFVVSFTGRLFLAKCSVNNEVFHCIMRNIVSCTFVMWIVIVWQKWKVNSKFFISLGKRSYEIYLTHVLLLPVINQINILGYMCVTLLSAYILNIFSNYIKGIVYKIYLNYVS